ncbi:macrolide family glycosyltransferase [Streptomyces sp. NPDC002932]|uniref:macrolide family glycosyltransferase n=1 Tax=Streptomyces sp. NPDC002932 TaxID=3364672 RepID=UPI00368CABC6
MTTRHVAVFMFPGYGHVNPTLEISRCLIALGHRVTYVLDEKFAAQVTAIGAEVVSYTSQRSRLGEGTMTGEDIGALGLTFLRESMDVILPRALEAFEDDVPELVLYDLESFFSARTAAGRWGSATVQLFPYVAANEHYALSLEVFDGVSESLQKCLDLITEHLAAEDTGPETAATFLANFDSRNVVLLPKSFQPLGETFDDRYTFTGHSLPADRPGTGSWQHPSGEGPVALITLGTEVNDRPDFFTDCVEAFDGSDWHLVMAVGPGNLPACRAAARGAAGVEMHEWLAFNTVLPHASAVVCHAGISTMLEAISFGKPLVVITYTPEDRVNGRRTEELGLGVALSGHELTPERLREAVETVAHSAHIRRQVARTRTEMLAAGGPARAARLIDGWLGEMAPGGPAAVPAVAFQEAGA